VIGFQDIIRISNVGVVALSTILEGRFTFCLCWFDLTTCVFGVWSVLKLVYVRLLGSYLLAFLFSCLRAWDLIVNDWLLA